jgi:hypothetical protein
VTLQKRREGIECTHLMELGGFTIQREMLRGKSSGEDVENETENVNTIQSKR